MWTKGQMNGDGRDGLKQCITFLKIRKYATKTGSALHARDHFSDN